MPLDDALFTQPIHGVRAWEVVDGPGGEPLLCGWAVNQVWPPGEPYRAACVATSFRRVPARGTVREPHLAPHPDCSCGIYAYHPARGYARRELIDKLSRCENQGVIGAVAAWGRLEVHDSGFRAERARPITLYRCRTDWEVGRRQLDRLAAAYGAEVVELESQAELPDALAELRGLDRRVVDRLVAEALALELGPYREEREDLMGEDVVVTGFRPVRVRGEEGRRGRRPQPRYLSFVVDEVRRRALRSDAFNLCREVRLREIRPPGGGQRRFEVTDATGELRVGMVPDGMRSLVRRLLATPGARAIVGAHERYEDGAERHGLEVLVTPHPRIAVWIGRPRRKVTLDPDDPIF